MAEKKMRRDERDERVSLHGLDPEEALRALLAVKPDDESGLSDKRLPDQSDDDSNSPES